MAVGDDLLGLPRSADHADRHGRDAGLAADLGGVGHLVAWAEREFLAAGRDAAGRGDDVVAAEFLQRPGDDDAVGDVPAASSEERRVGNECAITGRYRWSPYH